MKPTPHGGTPETQLRNALERLIDAARIPIAAAPIHWTGRTNGGGAIRFLLADGTLYHADPEPAPPEFRYDLAHVTRPYIRDGRAGGVFVSSRFSA